MPSVADSTANTKDLDLFYKKVTYLAIFLFFGSSLVLISILIGCTMWISRKLKKEQAFQSMLVPASEAKRLFETDESNKLAGRTFSGIYQGHMVAIKKLAINESVKVKKSSSLLKELKKITELQHENINPFIGACLEAPFFCLLTEYCSNGSVNDLLEDPEFHLDTAMKYSFLKDVVTGMTFLHDSPIESHGSLKSFNCVIDERFVLKVTDFGLSEVHGMEDLTYMEVEEHSFYLRYLWTSPELLRMDSNRPLKGTQASDVYSFGIILHELLFRRGVFYRGENVNPSPKDVVDNVSKSPQNGHQPYRPTIPNDSSVDEKSKTVEKLVELMKNSWAEKPKDRPTFKKIQSVLAELPEVKNADCHLPKSDIVDGQVETGVQELAEKISLISCKDQHE